MLHLSLLIPFLAVPVLAASNRTWGPIMIAGDPFSGLYPKPDDALFERNLQNPNATRSVKFKPFGSVLVNNPPIKSQEWTLRVNVSSMYIPFARSYEGKDGGPESHVVAFTWDLSWPGNASLFSAIGTNNTLCATMPDNKNWPVSATNAYTDTSANSTSCEPALGKECVKAILDTRRSSASRCQSPDQSWSKLPECANSFGLADKVNKGQTTVTWGISPAGGNSTAQGRNITYGPHLSGTAMGAQVMAPVDDDASSTYYEVTNRLHVFMLGAQIPLDGGGSQGVAELLCMRVNYTKLADNVRTDGDTTTVGDSVLKPASGSPMIDAGKVAFLATGMAVLVGLLTGGL